MAPDIPKGIDLLVSLTRKADAESLMMSRMHCHARNVSSIVLRRAGGRLFRAFLAWPGHRLHTNHLGDDLEVGIHDHRYDIWLSLIHGDVENVEYHRCEESVPLIEWRFRSGVASGSASFTKVGDARLKEFRREPLAQGKWLGMHTSVLHTVQCRGTAAWLVQEGATVKDETTLFTRGEISTDGLYQPFRSRHDVIDHVLNWAAEARK